MLNHSTKKVSQEEILERAAPFLADGIYDIRRMRREDYPTYQLMRKYKLMPKLSDMNPERRDEAKQKAYEKKLAKEREKRALKAAKEALSIELERDEDQTMKVRSNKSLFIKHKSEDGRWMCGRCRDVEVPYTDSKMMICPPCRRAIGRHVAAGRDTNKGNVRDAFAFTKVEWHGRTFVIELDVPDRDREFLTMLGYGFIFKERYAE